MASLIKIKRSANTASPAVLGAGELAYSWYLDTNKLYIGSGTEDVNGAAANIHVIGGKYFTDKLSHTPGTLTANSAIIVDSSSKIDLLKVDNLQLDGNTLGSTNLNGDINIVPNGTGKTVISNLYIGDTSTSIQEYIYDTVGGAVTAGTGITITNNDGANTSTVSITNTGVTAQTYGSTTKIPVITVNAQGQITSASEANLATNLSIAADTGTDSIALLTDTLNFVGGTGITSSINSSTNAVTFDIDATVATLTGAQTLTNKTISGSSNTITNIGNSSLVNSSVTFGSTTVSLGSTSTSIAGVTELTVDNLNFNGNSITSTDTNGNIVISPNGTGAVDVADSRITGVATPVNATDATNKAYVDNAITGLTFKQAVNLLSITNVALTGSTSTLVIDGHSALDSADSGYRILLIGQTTTAENGIYVYNDNGTTYSLTRPADADTYTELIGASVFVIEGTTYANTGWTQSEHYLTSFTGQEWVQFSGSGAYVAGNGLILTGTTFDVGGTADRISVSANAVDIASTYAGQASINTVGTITSGTWNGTIISPTYGGTGVNNGTKTITLGGNLTTSGAFNTTLTVTANTNVTLPTTGTLATLAGSETLSNKTITTSSFSGTTIAASGLVTLTNTTDASALGTAAVVLSGGLSVAKKIYVGTDIVGVAATSRLEDFIVDGGTY